jgi:pimeloyl-ACP methyl ester carboxylesterase
MTQLGTLAGEQTPSTPTIPLVLLHAFPLDHRMWEPAAAHLRDLPIVLIDLPGAGFSPVTAPTMAAAAGASAQTLIAAGFTRWVVGGVSMGGYVTMALARSHPDALAGLALIDTKPTADDADTRAARHATARRVLVDRSVEAVAGMAETLVGATTRAERPEMVAQVREWIAGGDAGGVAWAQTAMAARPDSRGTLREMRQPVSIIVGEEDQLSPPDIAEAMARAIPHAEFTVIPGAGHLSPVEQPQAVASALRGLYAKALGAVATG